MFSAESILNLEESLGYERFILEDCLRRLENIPGRHESLRIVFLDNEKCEIFLSGHCSISGPVVHEVYEQLVGLLFCAAYKALDMVMEWTIGENHLLPPRFSSFADKLKILENPGIIFPGFLNAEKQLSDVIIACYRQFLPYRNALTHGKWGNVSNGDLKFSFDKAGVKYGTTFPWSQVIAWVEAVNQLVAMVLDPVTITKKAIKILKQRLNILANQHKSFVFPKAGERSFCVTRITEQSAPFWVDIPFIKARLEIQAQGIPYEMDLRIECGPEGNRTCWEIPAESIPHDGFVLDASWDDFKLSR